MEAGRLGDQRTAGAGSIIGRGVERDGFAAAGGLEDGVGAGWCQGGSGGETTEEGRDEEGEGLHDCC